MRRGHLFYHSALMPDLFLYFFQSIALSGAGVEVDGYGGRVGWLVRWGEELLCLGVSMGVGVYSACVRERVCDCVRVCLFVFVFCFLY